MSREAYGKFAGVYDRLMGDVDYGAWAEYLMGLLRRAGMTEGAVLDCAAGTGEIGLRLAKEGYRVTCLDISADMLLMAEEKARHMGLSIPFVCQDMRRIALHRPVEAIVCACDGVNYLSSMEDVKRFFASAMAALKPGGVLLFDVSSEFKLSTLLGNTAMCEDGRDCAYLWQNAYDRGSRLLEMRLSFFLRMETGLYERFDERHIQRGHSERELFSALAAAGFTDTACYAAFSDRPPENTTQRLQFAARKPGLS